MQLESVRFKPLNLVLGLLRIDLDASHLLHLCIVLHDARVDELHEFERHHQVERHVRIQDQVEGEESAPG
jgi:hypothetical protein